MLSGFALAYLYLDRSGSQTVSNRSFWLARWIRVYPLHLVLLILIAPFATEALSRISNPTVWGFPVSSSLFVVLSGLLSLFLLQAWCPEAALTWNVPTWALSAIAFFYAVFPLLVRWLKGQSRRALWSWFWLMPVLNLAPSLVFLALTDGNTMSSNVWSEVVQRTPLLWLPHFAMAIILARLFHITRHDAQWAAVASRKGPSWGDAAGAILLMFLLLPDACYQKAFCLGSKPPDLILRHGLLAPLYAILIYHLAQNQGWISRLLSHSWLERLGEGSFGIFILQVPVGIATHFLLGLESRLLQVVTNVVLVVGLSFLSLTYFERPVARWLKRRLNVGTALQ